MPAYNSTKPTLRKKVDSASRKRAATTASQKQKAKTTVISVLKQPRIVNYAISLLFGWIQDGLVEINEPGRRGVVLGKGKETALIGAIIDNLPIAAIVFSIKRDENGIETRRCVVGAQRLTAIHRFMLGTIPLLHGNAKDKLYFLDPSGERQILPMPLQNAFKNKAITCIEYDDLTAEQEREISRRAQL